MDSLGSQEISELSSRCYPDALCTPWLVDDDATIHASQKFVPHLFYTAVASSRHLCLPNCYFPPLHQPLFIPGIYEDCALRRLRKSISPSGYLILSIDEP